MLGLYLAHRELILGVLLALGALGSFVALAFAMRAGYEDQLEFMDQISSNPNKDKD